MKRSIVFAAPEFLPLVPIAQEAEAAGFARVWTTENPGRDALVRALTFALATSTIEIGTGIAYAFTRAPLAMAAAAADVQEAAGGRLSLGIGAGTQGMRSRWFGIGEFDHPASRLEEYADVLRKAWSSAKEFHYEGRFYSGAYQELDGVRPTVPIWGSGINHTMLRIAARSCDGVAVHPLGANLTYLDSVVSPSVREGAAESGRTPHLALWRMTSIDSDGEVARERARRSLAFYFSTPSYGSVADATGWGEVAERIRNTFRAQGPDWDNMSCMIPANMVSEFCLAGTPAEVLKQWQVIQREYAARGVTETVFQTVNVTGSEPRIRNLRAIVNVLAPATSG